MVIHKDNFFFVSSNRKKKPAFVFLYKLSTSQENDYKHDKLHNEHSWIMAGDNSVALAGGLNKDMYECFKLSFSR